MEEEDKAAKRKSKKKKKEEKKGKKKSKKDKKEKDDADDDEYEGSGGGELEDMFEALARSEAEARSSKDKDKATPATLTSEDEVSTDGEGSVPESISYPEEWLEWEEFVSQQEGPNSEVSEKPKHPKGSNLTLFHPKVISESAFTIKSAFDSKSDIGKRF